MNIHVGNKILTASYKQKKKLKDYFKKCNFIVLIKYFNDKMFNYLLIIYRKGFLDFLFLDTSSRF